VPEVVFGVEGDLSKGENLGLNYSGLVPVLINAVKEQQKQIEELKSDLKILNVYIAEQKAKQDLESKTK
jgi:hypothetical protein